MNLTQDQIRLAGHAIECRINAEDPKTYAPSPGLITAYHPPGGPGIRIDTHAYAGYFVSPHYDSMIAKLIVYAPTRLEAIARMHRALDSFVIEGVKTSIPLQKKILEDPDFIAGKLSTKFMERFMPAGK
jgi:acetyl-CoA carboxylase biotin carboxylase subunit